MIGHWSVMMTGDQLVVMMIDDQYLMEHGQTDRLTDRHVTRDIDMVHGDMPHLTGHVTLT